eukprot:UN07037
MDDGKPDELGFLLVSASFSGDYGVGLPGDKGSASFSASNWGCVIIKESVSMKIVCSKKLNDTF